MDSKTFTAVNTHTGRKLGTLTAKNRSEAAKLAKVEWPKAPAIRIIADWYMPVRDKLNHDKKLRKWEKQQKRQQAAAAKIAARSSAKKSKAKYA